MAAGGRVETSMERTDRAAKKDTKVSLKTTFRSLMVHRSSLQAEPSASTLSMVIVTKEKKQKSKIIWSTYETSAFYDIVVPSHDVAALYTCVSD